MKNMKINKSILILVIMLIVSVLFGCEKVIENPLEIPQYVKKEPSYLTEIISKNDIYSSVSLYAKVHPINEETYAFTESSGYISEVFFQRGDEVKAGDLLVTLSDSDLLKLIRDTEVNYKIEKFKVDKLKEIYEATGNGKYDLDIALLDFQLSEYQYNKLLEKEKALYIYAEFDGVVDSTKASVNKYVNQNEGVISIVDKSESYLSFTDPEIPGLTEGTELYLFITTNESVTATVTKIDEKEKVVYIETEIQDDRLEKIGSLFKVEIITDQVKDAIAVKSIWIKEAAGREFVYVLENGIMTEREISKGKSLDGWVEILLGLQEGDEVIVNSN